MRRKGPPFKVVSGDESQACPAYVRSIEKSPIQLQGDPGELERLGLEREIPYTDTGPLETNEELIKIMLSLRDLGLAFGYDYKSHCSPGSFMQMLQDQGRLDGEYVEISWRSPGQWTLTTHEME